MSDFMEPQTTTKQLWLKIDGDHGITFVSLITASNTRAAFEAKSEDDQLAAVTPYYEGTPDSVEVVSGYGARFSAPGYLDCTDWSVFDTLEEAEQYLADESEDTAYDESDNEPARKCIDSACRGQTSALVCSSCGAPTLAIESED